MVQGHDLEAGQDVAVLLRCSSPAAADQVLAICTGTTGGSKGHSKQQQQGAAGGGGNIFDAKMDKASADLYFHYYGMLQHQQNMLQDYTRTGTYYCAIMENVVDFQGKVVMDVGAGSGILSLFAAQAGAARVYAVEASGMAKFARQLAGANASFGKAVQVLHSKVESLQLPEEQKVDVLVSEPMGTLLVNERMLETYLYARDHFLKPGGRMFPTLGRIHCGAFSDVVLYTELYNKGAFWQFDTFYGVDLRCLYNDAVEGYFAQVVVDAFDPSALVSDIKTHVLDFATMKEEDLYNITMPLDVIVGSPGTVHGIACWFDVLFQGSTSQRWLSTAPGMPTTHWFQLRCVLQQPIMVLHPNTQLSGSLRLVAHERQSYDVFIELQGPPLQPGMEPQRSMGKFDLKEPYYRQLTQWPAQQQQQQAGYDSAGTSAGEGTSYYAAPGTAAVGEAPTGDAATTTSQKSATANGQLNSTQHVP